MMAVLSGAGNAPAQPGYVYYGPCGYSTVYYSAPWVAYYPVERVYVAADAGLEKRAVLKKLDDLTAMIGQINRRLDVAEGRFQAMDDQHRRLAQSFEKKLENQAKQQQLALDARMKEERVRQDLEVLKEKTRFLEYSAKIVSLEKRQENQARLEKLQQQMEKLQGQLKRVESSLKTMVNIQRIPEASLSISEASEDQGDVPENRALIVVNLPEKAKLFLNGQPRKGHTKQRFILTPQLEDGEYSYTLRVDTERDGRVRSQTRQVSFRRGMQIRVTFEP
jgi:uncharacterized protein (TIGR03000 family)